MTGNFTIKEADKRVASNRGRWARCWNRTGTGESAVKGTIITVTTVSAGGDNVQNTYKIVDFKDKTLEYVQAALAEEDILKTAEEPSDEVEREGHANRPCRRGRSCAGRDADRLYQHRQGRKGDAGTQPVRHDAERGAEGAGGKGSRASARSVRLRAMPRPARSSGSP